MNPTHLDRRDMFKSLLALSAVGAVSACGGAQEATSTEANLDATPEPATSGFFNAAEMTLISAIADTIIPATETVGAVGAGVPDTIQALATDWGNDEFRTYWRGGLADIGSVLTERAGGDFSSLDAEQRLAALAAYDAAVFDWQIDDGFYRALKATVVEAYYMSEPGATEELAYEPVPGEWIGCVPLSEYPKTWAT
jgi:gluconate 2-dehydrogenase gamma chain